MTTISTALTLLILSKPLSNGPPIPGFRRSRLSSRTMFSPFWRSTWRVPTCKGWRFGCSAILLRGPR